MRSRVRVPAPAFLGTLILAILQIAYAGSVHATHFRYGHIVWVQTGGTSVEATVQNAWRWNGFTTTNGSCIDPLTLFSVACTGPGGGAGVGDIVVEYLGGTVLDWGDGTTPTSSPFDSLMYLVTAIDPDDNWLFGLAIDPASLPAVDTTISHDYDVLFSLPSASGPPKASIDSCCRISRFAFPNEHINNPDGYYRVETVIDVGTGNSSPVSALPPVVICPVDDVCSFVVPGADPDGDSLSFRLSSSAEAASFGDFVQPGPPFAPNAATIDSATGLYTWDTTGATTTVLAGWNTVYSTQVSIEDPHGAKVAVDFLIVFGEDAEPPQITPPAGSPPICGTTQVVSAGVATTFDIAASDADTSDLVTLNVAGLPVGATMSPSLPITGNPVSSTFSWIPAPGQVGVYIANFTANSSSGGQALCPVTIEVVSTLSPAIDLTPGDDLDRVNPRSRGVLPLAVLSTALDNGEAFDFDALTLDPASLRFGPAEARIAHSGGHFEDVDLDGDLDLVVHFRVPETAIACGDSSAILSGETLGGTAIEAVATFETVGCP